MFFCSYFPTFGSVTHWFLNFPEVYQRIDWEHLPHSQGIVSVVRRQLCKIAGQAAIGILKFQLAETVNIKIVRFIISEGP